MAFDRYSVMAYERAIGSEMGDAGTAIAAESTFVNPFVLSRLLRPIMSIAVPEGTARGRYATFLHAEQAIETYGPLVVGQVLRALVGAPAAFRYGLRTTAISVNSTIIDPDNMAVARLGTVLATTDDCGLSLGSPSQDRWWSGSLADGPVVAGPWVRTYRAEDLRVYAASANDATAIHLDRVAAEAVGLPGLVVHGMYTLAAGISEAVQRLGACPRRDVALVSTRFSRPLIEGQEVAYEVRALPDRGSYALHATHRGRAVLKGCRFKIREREHR